MFFISTRRAIPLLLALLAISLPAFQRKEEEDEDFDMPLERWHYLYDQRQSSPTEFPEGARLRAFRALERMERDRAAAKTNARRAEFSGAWKAIGPQPIQYATGYVTSGRVTALAVDPRSADTFYIGGADGGVWKTTDGGSSWKPITDDQPSLAIGSLALDSTNPDTIFAGTGEENFSIDAYSGVGILRSENGGATWTNIVGPFARQRVGAISVSPADGKILLAASNCQTTDGCAAPGIYRSADSGQSWNLVLSGVGTSVYFEPNQPNVAWAGVGSVRGAASNGVYRSTDAGKTWKLMTGATGAAIPSGTTVGRVEIVSAGTTIDSAYAAIANAINGGGATLNGLYKTTDGGQHWTRLGAPDFCTPQCWYDLTVRQQPNDPNVIFAGGVQLYRSTNGGLSWSAISNSSSPHVDHHALQFSVDGTRFYDANDGGVWSSDNFTSPGQFTIRWNNLNNGLSLTQYYSSLSMHPTDPTISLAGSQDNGTHLYQGSTTWTRVISGDGGWTAIDPASPNVAYAEYVDIAIFKTRSGDFSDDFLDIGQGIDMTDRAPFIASFVIDPQNPERLYYGTHRLYRTTDGGGLWKPISGDLTNAPQGATSSTYTISAIAVAPTDTNTIYTGARSGAVYATSNGGANWREVSSMLPSRGVGHITVDPIDPATVYVAYTGFSSITETVGGHVFRSRDRGASWSDITSNLPNAPINDLVIDPDIPDTLYVGTDLGAMVSSDSGGTWDTLGSGMPRTAVMSLVLHRPTRTLRAATHGRGAYDYALGGGSSSAPVIKTLTPSGANAGGSSLALTITGSNFTNASHVRWNGEERPVSSATATTITLTIPARDIQSVGRAAVTVVNMTSGGGASAPANFIIGPAPALPNNGAVNSANPTGNATASPGALVSLYGSNFAAALTQQVSFPLPETLGGVVVTVGGAPAPLYFVSPGQINFQVPYETVSNAPVPVVISQGSQVSNAITLNMARVSPGLFSTNQQGSGQGAVRIAGGATIAAPVGAFPDSRPVKAGDVIEIYCTGLGYVSPNGITGGAASAGNLQNTISQPSVTIGGKSGIVLFSGLAPGVAGLYQVDVQIPQGVTPGDAVPVALTILGVQSNTVTIAVQ